jgi:hypothetical protein
MPQVKFEKICFLKFELKTLFSKFEKNGHTTTGNGKKLEKIDFEI